MSLNKYVWRKKRYFFNNPSKLLLYPIVKKVEPYTLVKYVPLVQCHDIILKLDEEGIEGSIVEMGCWKGGLVAFLAWTVKHKGKIKRDVWGFDSFEGFPSFEGEDKRDAERTARRHGCAEGALKARISDALTIGRRLKIKPYLIKGWFEEEVPSSKGMIGPIALLRLDGDLYSSTKYCLEQLYDQVADGGYIVIDDWHNWIGCRKAVYEFFNERGMYPVIAYCPSPWHLGRAYFRKIPENQKL